MTGISGISDYDWDQIFDNSTVDRRYAQVLYDWTDGSEEASFCGIVKNTLTGSYYSFSAWHDYTGWDCRSGVDWFGPHDSIVGATSQLTQVDRRHLGFDHTPEHKGLYRD